ncbi:carboxymuconolactone decarboxylase family protein [Mucilaginibacter sp. L3T2-6]|uniref:carboxymuconolactone decarboxylase family protein n=1 Tax=Mucilaginibacter sp. L3T2-6 TaxID=3062491 RepID=UPI002674A431|nr:carboxymuconolactone decarboxylase family protein [Mucilaginibacter sp. L3T2-6]MDO3644260.1 carboxymuconolactone decarboxylase family protein [Mucilaginibacter sp. L3T2-6]MDV6216643.1 carboxymuconolactone decarboxylase family protein [Mucilaginibacter sp. L3T2-6]
MTRLTAINPEEATGKTKELFDGIQSKLGVVPNMMRTMGHSPALLEGYLNLNAALSHGKLGGKRGELLALTIGETNSCDYCLSAHSYIGEKLVHIDTNTLQNARNGNAADEKTAAILKFANVLLEKKGRVNDADVESVKAAGLTEGEIAEIIGHVGLNVLTNYFNNAADTAIDFPVVRAGQLV